MNFCAEVRKLQRGARKGLVWPSTVRPLKEGVVSLFGTMKEFGDAETENEMGPPSLLKQASGQDPQQLDVAVCAPPSSQRQLISA
jgi:hypothetical protein